MRKMGYNYELNVGATIYPNVYENCVKHIVEEYDGEWGQKAHTEKNLQYVYVNSSCGEIFLQRIEVIRNGKTEEEYIISQNVNSLKSGETNGFFTMQQEIVDAKDNMEDFLREVGFDVTFQLEELMIGITEQETPYMK